MQQKFVRRLSKRSCIRQSIVKSKAIFVIVETLTDTGKFDSISLVLSITYCIIIMVMPAE